MKTLDERLMWAKQNLDPIRSDYRVVFENPDELNMSIDANASVKVLTPDPNWMAAALHGNILPPVWVYWELAKDEAQPGFTKHTRLHLLHETEPVEAMTEEEAMEYLVMKDIPSEIWDTRANRPRFKICRMSQIPSDRQFRAAWALAA